MSGKGSSRHLNRMASSRYMHVEKKVSKYVAKPTFGRHTLESSVSLITVLREKINAGNSAYEIRRAVKSGKIKVNGKAVTNERYAIGLEDIIEIVPEAASYRIGVDKKGGIDIKKTDNMKQTLKIVGKYVYKKGRVMIRLHDGTVIDAIKGADVNDSVQLDNRKVEKVIKFEKGASCRIISGVHSSESGKITGIKKGTSNREPVVEIESGGNRIETVLRNIIVTGV